MEQRHRAYSRERLAGLEPAGDEAQVGVYRPSARTLRSIGRAAAAGGFLERIATMHDSERPTPPEARDPDDILDWPENEIVYITA